MQKMEDGASRHRRESQSPTGLEFLDSVGRIRLGSSCGRIKQIQEADLFSAGKNEASNEFASQLPQVLVGKTKVVLGQLVFPAQRSPEHCGIIRVERDHNTLVKIIAYGMLGYGWADASTQVARNANLNRNLPLGERFHQLGVLAGGKSVPDPLGWQVLSAPHIVIPAQQFRQRAP